MQCTQITTETYWEQRIPRHHQCVLPLSTITIYFYITIYPTTSTIYTTTTAAISTPTPPPVRP